MAAYDQSVRRSAGSDPLVPEPVAGRKRPVARPDAATMRNLQKQGKAMPPLQAGGTGRFPIRNAGDLDNAIKAVGRVAPAGRPKVRKYIMARAKALGLSKSIPDTWNADGTLKTGSDSGS
jgi:hypothetical protein